MPDIRGMRWSTRNRATGSPRVELAHGAQGRRAGLGAQDTVVLAVVAAQVALDGAQDVGIVVDGQQDGLARHGNPRTSHGHLMVNRRRSRWVSVRLIPHVALG
jgi:hypothetical protein